MPSKRDAEVLSIGIKPDSPYAAHGLEHFLFRYGIRAAINRDESPDIGICYGSVPAFGRKVNVRVAGGNIGTAVCGYLGIDDEIPLFEVPDKQDTAEGETLAVFQTGADS